jgi:hypothetical protein
MTICRRIQLILTEFYSGEYSSYTIFEVRR